MAVGLAAAYCATSDDVRAIVSATRKELTTVATAMMQTVTSTPKARHRAAGGCLADVTRSIAKEYSTVEVDSRRARRRRKLKCARSSCFSSSESDDYSVKRRQPKRTRPTPHQQRVNLNRCSSRCMSETSTTSTAEESGSQSCSDTDDELRRYNRTTRLGDDRPPVEVCVESVMKMMHLDDDLVLPQGDYTFDRYVRVAKDYRRVLEDSLPNKVNIVVGTCCNKQLYYKVHDVRPFLTTGLRCLLMLQVQQRICSSLPA